MREWEIGAVENIHGALPYIQFAPILALVGVGLNRIGKDSFYGYNEYLAEKKSIKATFKRRLDIVEKFIEPGTLLDVGCAMGFLLDLARDQGWTVEGVELSEYACLHAVEELHLPVLHGTLHDAEFDGGKFDAVTLFDVIEHFPNPRKEIREVARVLRPGGIFAVTTPDVGSLVARLLAGIGRRSGGCANTPISFRGRL